MTATCRKRTNAGTIAIGLFVALSISGCGGGTSPNESAVANGTQMRALSVPTPAGVTVVSLMKVSEARISRTVYDYIFKITVKNDSTAKIAIMATATGAGPGTTILDGSVLVGDMAANAAVTPSDTITLRHDRAIPFNSSALVWQISEPINGFPVPPEPDSVLNEATLAGVDSNRNGVRDDIERAVAGRLEAASDFPVAIRYLSAYEAIVKGPSPTDRPGALTVISKILCTLEGASPAVRDLPAENLYANTTARKGAIRIFYRILVAYSPRELSSCS